MHFWWKLLWSLWPLCTDPQLEAPSHWTELQQRGGVLGVLQIRFFFSLFGGCAHHTAKPKGPRKSPGILESLRRTLRGARAKASALL